MTSDQSLQEIDNTPMHEASQARIFRESLLRSINIQHDAEHPERIGHFRPTAKTIPLLRALLGEENERAFFIVAPYGSGKSITATYLLQLVENRQDAKNVLQEIEKRLGILNPQLARFSSQRRSTGEQGFTLALHGHCPSIPEAIKTALLKSLERLAKDSTSHQKSISLIDKAPCQTMPQALKLLDELRFGDGFSYDRILILWDEFGRHLETLLERGQASELNELQSLAEYTSRTKESKVTLGLLLHQQLLQYAKSLSQLALSEWKKIEGRFQTIHYVDDSKEIYELLAELVHSFYPECPVEPTKLSNLTTQSRRFGLFREFYSTERDLEALFTKAYPIEPVTLFLLPKVAARVAQNERTLFTFLQSLDFSTPITLAHLYDYFSPAMQEDIGVGGTYKQWLETESAISKLQDAPEAATSALKAACLLSLGIHGERTRAGKEQLRFALESFSPKGDEEAIIEDLIARKLLLYRKHSNEVAVWHGTDVDLRSRLEEERFRNQHQEVDLVRFLRTEARPPFWRPVMHNAQYCIKRYFAGGYADMAMLKEREGLFRDDEAFQQTPEEKQGDGYIWYVVANDREELGRAESWVTQEEQKKHPTRLIVLASKPLRLREAALEIRSLLAMQQDQELLSQDPLVAAELQHMLDDARDHLQKLTEQLLQPGSPTSRWFYRGEELKIRTAAELRLKLSEIMNKVYDKTPKINNELIVRNQPSRTIINARKKLLMGILERYGTENLGLEGFRPDASMFRTVLCHTGLYKRSSKTKLWQFVSARSLKNDEGLKDIWLAFKGFFTETSKEAKSIKKFMKGLIEPPYGVRKGLFPIFFACAFKAFPSAKQLLHDGEYLDDLLPSHIELLCKEPERFRFHVIDLSDDMKEYLRWIHFLFSGKELQRLKETDLIRKCYDAIEAWKAKLPEASLETRLVSEKARHFQTLLHNLNDPLQFLFEDLPKLFSISPKRSKGSLSEKEFEALKPLEETIKELEGAVDLYREQVKEVLKKVLFQGEGLEGLLETAQTWSANFPESFIKNLPARREKNLLLRMKMPYDTDQKLIDSLASLLAQRTITHWDDGTIKHFTEEFEASIQKIVELTQHGAEQHEFEGEAQEILAKFLSGRIESLALSLTHLLGHEKAQDELTTILHKLAK